MLYWGASVGFFRGDVKLLFDDIQTLKPTVFPSVPRIWNVLYGKVFSALDGAGKIKSLLFHKAYAAKQEGLKHGILNLFSFFSWDFMFFLWLGRYTDGFWDPVFSKVRDKLGGNVRLLVTGSAPIAPHVMEFLRICFACPVVEGN